MGRLFTVAHAMALGWLVVTVVSWLVYGLLPGGAFPAVVAFVIVGARALVARMTWLADWPPSKRAS